MAGRGGWPSGWKVRRGTAHSLDPLALTDAGSAALSKTVEELWQEQPHLRTVVDFLARNVAQLPLTPYQRNEDGGRERLRKHPLAEALARPNPQMTGFEFVRAIVSALALYDRVLIWVVDRTADGKPFELRVVPEGWISETADSTPFSVGTYVLTPDGETPIKVSADDVIELHGWSPDLRVGVSPVESLKSVLSEQIQAQMFRQQMWRNGGRIGSYITRPKDAPDWSNANRHRFLTSWNASHAGNGKKVGGTPVLEDGMELKRVGFSAKDEDYVEGSKLALTTVAAVYHVNPTMIGVLDNANYSNVREFRQMLYVDTLGPILGMIEAKLNAELVTRFPDADGLYVEFNLREKLEGSFAEQSTSLAGALTAGYMTVNEVRQKLNMTALPGGDVLRAPLNMAPAAVETTTRSEAA